MKKVPVIIRKTQEYKNLHNQLHQTNLHKTYERRNTAGVGYTNIFGHIWPTMKCNGECVNNRKYPKLYKALCEFGKTVPVKWSAIQVNKNYQCKPHKDIKNIGDSFIISFGSYAGGELNIEGTKHNIRKGLVFNGFKHEHWVEPFEGTRFTVCYFNAFTDGTLEYRKGTSDEKVIKEINYTKIYEKCFPIESSDNWLDLGANFGCFTQKCLYKGCFVRAVEPEPKNFFLLKKNTCTFTNVELFEGAVSIHDQNKLYLAKSDTNHWRHTLIPVKGRTTIDVKIYKIEELLKGIDAIKIDIEGAEIELLEYMDESHFKSLNKLVFEYSFDKDRSIPRFNKIIEKLKKNFDNVKFKVKQDQLEYNYFPACDNVYCWNNKKKDTQ